MNNDHVQMPSEKITLRRHRVILSAALMAAATSRISVAALWPLGLLRFPAIARRRSEATVYPPMPAGWTSKFAVVEYPSRRARRRNRHLDRRPA